MKINKSWLLTVSLTVFISTAHAWWRPAPLNTPIPYSGAMSPQLDTRKRMHIDKFVDDRGYVLEIYLEGIEPDSIESKIQAGALLLRSSRASVSTHSGMFGQRSFSNSFSVSRRIRLPADADASRMQRRDVPGKILILLPRRQPGSESWR